MQTLLKKLPTCVACAAVGAAVYCCCGPSPPAPQKKKKTPPQKKKKTPQKKKKTPQKKIEQLKTPTKKERLLHYQENKCAYCSCKLSLNTATIEHLIPQSLGGPKQLWNECVVCRECNQNRKAIIDYAPFRRELARRILSQNPF